MGNSRGVLFAAMLMMGACACARAPLAALVTSPARPRAVEAAYVCPPEALLLLEQDGKRALLVVSRQWLTTNGWRDGEGDHFVLFERTEEARVSREYVLPLDRTAGATLREYNRRLGSRFTVEVDGARVWRVRGTPSSTFRCGAAVAHDAPCARTRTQAGEVAYGSCGESHAAR